MFDLMREHIVYAYGIQEENSAIEGGSTQFNTPRGGYNQGGRGGFRGRKRGGFGIGGR
jgi:hypothetical protein